MPRINFTLLRSGDTTLDRVQVEIQTSLLPLLELPFASGSLIKDQVLGTSDTYVDHKLGITPEGWMIIKQNADTSIYESATTNHVPDKAIILKAGATVTVSIFFF